MAIIGPRQTLDPINKAYGDIGRGDSPPTQEVGAVTQGGLTPWSMFAWDELEQVPELQFPQSVQTYHAMRNDSQIEGLHFGCTMPVRRYKWMLDPNGCAPDRVQRLAKDLGLIIKGDDPNKPKGRSKNRFVFRQHLKDCMLAMLYGFYPFEQVGYIGDDEWWHIKKLAPRPPITVQEIKVDPSGDGGLYSIVQNISPSAQNTGPGYLPEISVNRLVLYCWDKEGANWTGRSMLRSVYRNWLIKDRLLRVDAIKHERNGVGVPTAFGAAGMTDDELKALARLAQSYKAGESAGQAFPHGTDMKLLGTQGSLPDTIASINMHNEEMSRRWLMMFLQLGSTLHGSRSLGKDFVDYFQLAQEEVANWFVDTFNEHVIEDYWDWNYGEDEENTPLIVFERDDDPRFAAADLSLMIQNGVIQVDDDIEQAVREAMDLPDFDPKADRTALPRLIPTTEEPAPGVGDVPGQPSTQPGNTDPVTPGDEQSTAPQNKDKVQASRTTRSGAGELSSPADDPSRSDRDHRQRYVTH